MKELNKLSTKSISTLMVTNENLNKAKGEIKVEVTRYQWWMVKDNGIRS